MSITWLGFELDLGQGQIRVLRHKIMALKERFQFANSSLRLPAKLLTIILGQLASIARALGRAIHLWTCSLH